MSQNQRCDGCKHNWYSADNGQQGYPGCDPILLQPHSRCLHFAAYQIAPKCSIHNSRVARQH